MQLATLDSSKDGDSDSGNEGFLPDLVYVDGSGTDGDWTWVEPADGGYLWTSMNVPASSHLLLMNLHYFDYLN